MNDEDKKNKKREYDKEYNKKNKEKIKKQKQKYKKENKEKIKIKRMEKHNDNKNSQEYKDKLNLKAAKFRERHKERLKQKRKEYVENNKDKIKKQKQKFYENNKEILKKKRKIYVENNKEKVKLTNLKWRRKQKSPMFLIKNTVGGSINKYLKSNGYSKKNNSCWIFLPYTKAELILHIESLFDPWMTWDNWGIYNPKTHDENPKWQLDHIIPHSTFNYDSMEHPDFQKCWALENLRPLDAKQNHLDGVSRIRHK